MNQERGNQMLAIREERRQLSFFEYTKKEDVQEYFAGEYVTALLHLDEGELASVPQLAVALSELIIQELYLRQLNVGDVGMFPSREECIEAYDNEEKMNSIMEDAHEVFDRSEMFSRNNSYTSEFEQMLIDDVILLLEEMQLMYARPHSPEDGAVFTDSQQYPCSVENCVLQEVW